MEMTDSKWLPLRDYFAGLVLMASYTHEKNQVCLGGGDNSSIKQIAEDCYKAADAMMEARK